MTELERALAQLLWCACEYTLDQGRQGESLRLIYAARRKLEGGLW